MKISPKLSRTIFWSICLAGIIIGGIGALADIMAMVFIGVAFLIAGLVFHIITYRCPHCSSFLDRSAGEYCPHCGKKITEKSEE